MSKTTDFLEQQADLLFENVSGWEQRTLERIGRRIKKMGEMPLYDVKSINLMAETKGEMEAIIKDLAKITGQNVQDVQNMYAEAIETQHLENSPIYDYRNKTFVPFSENKDLQSLVKAYSKSTNETMINLSKTKALGFIDKAGNFKNMQDSIYDVFGKATMTVATGTSDFHTAMRDAIEQLGGSGIRVHYGSGVTRRLDTVVRQNILWGAKQASVAYTEMIGEELDCDGIEIDYHSNPRPSHEFMQGKQYSLIGKKTINGVTYESADEALERLEDYGCLHYKTPIILGISEPRYSDKELAELKRQDQEQKEVTFEKQVNGETVKTTMSKTGYEWTQAMRQLETEARKEKEIINTLKASGDNIGAKQHKQRLKTINKKYNEIAEQTGIPARLDRMSIVKGGSAPQKPLTNSGSGGIIKSGAVSGARNPYGEKAKEHAEKYYGLVRSMKTDVSKIAKTTGFSEEQIQNVKNFIFYEKHDLGGQEPELFKPDFMMSESWKRLIAGKPEPHDITLLNHEIMERDLIKKGHTQDEAHIMTSKKYNYDKEATEFYDKIKKYND